MKRDRWTLEETINLLNVKRRKMSAVKSFQACKKLGLERDFESIEEQWNKLRDDYKRVRQWQCTQGGYLSYFDMDPETIEFHELPPDFPELVYDTMDHFLQRANPRGSPFTTPKCRRKRSLKELTSPTYERVHERVDHDAGVFQENVGFGDSVQAGNGEDADGDASVTGEAGDGDDVRDAYAGEGGDGDVVGDARQAGDGDVDGWGDGGEVDDDVDSTRYCLRGVDSDVRQVECTRNYARGVDLDDDVDDADEVHAGATDGGESSGVSEDRVHGISRDGVREADVGDADVPREDVGVPEDGVRDGDDVGSVVAVPDREAGIACEDDDFDMLNSLEEVAVPDREAGIACDHEDDGFDMLNSLEEAEINISRNSLDDIIKQEGAPFADEDEMFVEPPENGVRAVSDVLRIRESEAEAMKDDEHSQRRSQVVEEAPETFDPALFVDGFLASQEDSQLLLRNVERMRSPEANDGVSPALAILTADAWKLQKKIQIEHQRNEVSLRAVMIISQLLTAVGQLQEELCK